MMSKMKNAHTYAHTKTDKVGKQIVNKAKICLEKCE